MKLLFCGQCHDVRRISGPGKEPPAKCRCGATWGYYKDDLNVAWGSTHDSSCLLGFSNSGLAAAHMDQMTKGDKRAKIIGGRRWVPGREFAAFIIPDSAATVERKDKP